MTAFDVFALLAVLVSALIGYARGGVREVVTLCAFGVAAFAAVGLLRFTGPALAHLVHPGWVAAVAAVVIVFVLAYVAVRTAGGALTEQLRRSSLGGMDRAAGAGFGVLRALILLGLAALLLDAAPWPSGERPAWLARAVTYPVAHASGRTLARLAPAGGGAVGGFGRFFSRSVSDGFQPSIDEATGDGGTNAAEGATGEADARTLTLRPSDDAAPRRETAHRHHGYTRQTRDRVDTLVERTR